MPIETNCLICSARAKVEEYTERTKVFCARCGNFAVTSTARKIMKQPSGDAVAKISGWIREHQDVTIRVEDLPTLYDLRMPSVGEKAEKILLYVARNYPRPGDGIKESEMFGPILWAVAWAAGDTELTYLIQDYLTDEKKFLRSGYMPGRTEPCRMITPTGWAHLDSLTRGNHESVTGFVAMWFDDSMNRAFSAIELGIRAAGYKTLRIDRYPHNNKIDDEIIAGIRRSKFLVADFTGHRGGVYFEAGFAKGLGLEVVWLCREDDLENLHFDTRQYSHIMWQDAKLPELTKALKDRIEATIGHGPVM